MLGITKEAYQLINSNALILEHLYDIEYGNLFENPDGTSVRKDIDGNVVLPMKLTGAKIPIQWGIHTYTPATIEHTDCSQDGSGKVTEATLTVGNADREIQKIISWYDLAKKRVFITKLIMEKSGGIMGAIQIPMTIKEITTTEKFATFSLSVGVDVLGIGFPTTTVRANVCRWVFKGLDCRYSGPDSSCSKSWWDCIKKGNSRYFGGFPGVINEKFYI